MDCTIHARGCFEVTVDILESRPRIPIDRQELARCILAYHVRKPDVTIEQLAELTCKSTHYIRQLLDEYSQPKKEES